MNGTGDEWTMPSVIKPLSEMEKKKTEGIKASIDKEVQKYDSHIQTYEKELSNTKHDLHYPAHFTAARIARGIEGKYRELSLLAARGRNIKTAQAYAQKAQRHEDYAETAKPFIKKQKDYQERINAAKIETKIPEGLAISEKDFRALLRRLKNSGEKHTTQMQEVVEEYRRILSGIPQMERNLSGFGPRERASQHRGIAEMLRTADALKRHLKVNYNHDVPKDKKHETLPLKYVNEDLLKAAKEHEAEAERFDKAVGWQEKNPNPFLESKRPRR